MNRTLAAAALALPLTLLALTGCGDDAPTSGESNPDSQVEQPPLPGSDEATPQG